MLRTPPVAFLCGYCADIDALFQDVYVDGNGKPAYPPYVRLATSCGENRKTLSHLTSMTPAVIDYPLSLHSSFPPGCRTGPSPEPSLRREIAADNCDVSP